MTDLIREKLRAAYLEDESTAMARLSALARLDEADRADISRRGAALVREIRDTTDPGLMEEFLAEFGLSTQEGVALMCLAEALLRVPDAETIDELIQDKIAPHDWGAHLGKASSSLVNASTWDLMLTGHVIDEEDERGVLGTLRAVVRRLGEPVVRVAVARAMREMGAQFVLGRDISEAIRNGNDLVSRGYTYSYDMLGEGARTERDAQRYHGAYAHAIATLAHRAQSADVRENPGISVKLSALHPRYEYGQREEMMGPMHARVLQLAQAAKSAHMGFNIDAEEADRLGISLDIVESVLSDPSLAGWEGFGVVVQAYGPRAAHTIEWLYALAERLDRRIMVRLVKGAYWDTEIKRAQVLGLDGFPVFTRKEHTDVSYIACARMLLDCSDRIYPQFATHNAHSVSAILAMGNDKRAFEFQRLHGMGEALHDVVLRRDGTRCRIYAPVGAHRDLLAYLVRRLLENGANSSFVNQIVDETVPPEIIARDPFEDVGTPARIARGPDIYGSTRRNARGWDITDPLEIARMDTARGAFRTARWVAGDPANPVREIINPADPSDVVGMVHEAGPTNATDAVGTALAAYPDWAAREDRPAILERAADLYEQHAAELMALAAREAGKTLLDGVGELREAVDFLRYYALEATRAQGEARGVFACISPWNFPLAIFTGQIAAALVSGNTVVAKPAEQTPLIAARAVALLHEAGVPEEVLQILPGDGPSVGAPLVADPRLAGVCFTGSTEVAQIINRQLAKTAPEARLIAETGGLNGMIVDSTALPEQAVRDILASAFQSAGQRCSALRVLYIQRDVEERFLEMLFGAMDALRLGNPWRLSTDVGPLIDQEAKEQIAAYCARMEDEGRLLHRLDAPEGGHFLAPHVFRVSGIEAIEQEIFGPVLHIARFNADQIDEVIEAINAKGYGLTFGLHTRIDARVQHVLDRLEVGNAYVNRNQIGAIVGSQPFGGEGLSGTGPKAGGPLYLSAFQRTKRLRTPTPDPSPPTGEGGASITTSDLSEAFASLDASEWRTRRDRNAALRDVLRGRAGDAMSEAARMDRGPIDLPGPTGESNRYWLDARGAVLCLGPGEDLLDQVVQALAAGNSVVAVSPVARPMIAELAAVGMPVMQLVGGLPTSLEEVPIDAVAYTGHERSAELRTSLAVRSGPIIPLIREHSAPEAYCAERAVCIDTTAAGGNTALLAANA